MPFWVLKKNECHFDILLTDGLGAQIFTEIFYGDVAELFKTRVRLGDVTTRLCVSSLLGCYHVGSGGPDVCFFFVWVC
jgi:hypothetical protein